jgi:membrane protein implicated in regulation of membrane protease activity
MFSSMQRSNATLTIAAVSPIGRFFVLGLPDKHGVFRIFLDGQVWRIAPGPYRQGERVRVEEAEDGVLQVGVC